MLKMKYPRHLLILVVFSKMFEKYDRWRCKRYYVVAPVAPSIAF